MNKALNIIGAVCLSLVVLGGIFKVQHWPGGGVLFVSGTTIFLIFLCFRFFANLKNAGGGLGIVMELAQCVALVLLSMGMMFKVQHWPGAMPMLFVGQLVLVFGFLPLIAMVMAKDREKFKVPGRTVITLFTFGALFFSVNQTGASYDVLTSYRTLNSGLIEASDFSQQELDEMVSRLEVSKTEQPEVYQKATMIYALNAELVSYIEGLKKHLIQAADRLPLEAPDSLLTLEKMVSIDNYDIPTMIMIGDPAIPKTGEYTANDLRLRLNKFERELSKITGNPQAGALLKTPDFGIRNGYMESWEVGHFYHNPMASVICTLNTIELNVRTSSRQAINDLENKAH